MSTTPPRRSWLRRLVSRPQGRSALPTVAPAATPTPTTLSAPASGGATSKPTVSATPRSVRRWWDAFTASLIGCLPILPLLGTAFVLFSAIAPLPVSWDVPFKGYTVLDGTLIGLALWFVSVLVFFFLGFPTVERANSRVYGELCARLAQVDSQLAVCAGLQLTITPGPPKADPAGNCTYFYTLRSSGSKPLDQVTISFTVPGATSAGPGPTPTGLDVDGWRKQPILYADMVSYTCTSFGPVSVAVFTIAVPVATPLAIDVQIEAVSALAVVRERTTFDPVQAACGTVFIPLPAAVREAHTHREAVAAELCAGNAGLRWVLATGYINAWGRIHRAEEALMLAEPLTELVADGLYDGLRLKGSTIANRDYLTSQLQAALQALSPPAAGLLQGPSYGSSANAGPLPTFQAIAVLRQVHSTINEVRDATWDGLVRGRNRLYAAIFTTSLAVYALVAFVLSQRQPPAAHTVVVVGALYLIGAVVGLFNQLYQDAQSNQAVEDYGLFLARLINTPILSGLAAVFGVALTVLLPTALAPAVASVPSATSAAISISTPGPSSVMSAGGTPLVSGGQPDTGTTPEATTSSESTTLTTTPPGTSTVTDTLGQTLPVSDTASPTQALVATLTPMPTTTATPGGAGLSLSGGPQLANVYDLDRYPLEVVFAAVFGLTPGLLVSRLSDQAAALKSTISSTDPANNA